MLLLLALVPGALRAPPIAAPQDIVQPWTYRSPSGEIQLFVDPSTRRGAGKASYVLTRGTELVWAGELPYTLCDAIVLDDGSAGGYAYTDGLEGFGQLVVAALGADGSERWVKREQRVSPSCSVRDPTVHELQGCEGGVALRWSWREEKWWTFDWSSGRPLKQRLPLEAVPEPTQVEEAPAWPSVELSFLGRVEFPWPLLPDAGDDPRSQAERRGRGPHRVLVDGLGRVWISELSTRVVHGFDTKGLPFVELEPDPRFFRPFRPIEWMSLRGDGHLLVCGDRGVEEFNVSGARVGRTSIEDSPPRWLFLPGTKSRWSVEGVGRIELFGEDGQRRQVIERGANGRWFQNFFVAAVAPDGSLTVLDQPNPWISSRDSSTWVHSFAPTGEARRSLRVPDEFGCYGGHIAFGGRRIALLQEKSLLLLNVDGSPIGRMTLPEELGEPYYLFFSPSGDELWIFPHCRHEMFRFALP